MSKTLLVILFVVFNCFANAQHSFDILYSTPKNEVILDFYEEENGNFLAVGQQGHSSNPQHYKGLILRITPQGDTVSRTYYRDDTLFAFRRITPSGDNNYHIFGYAIYPPDYHKDLLIAKLDSNLDIVRYVLHDFTALAHYSMKALPASGGNGFHLLSFIVIENIGHEYTLLCRFNENLDLIRHKIMYEFGTGQSPWDMVYSEDSSDFYIIGTGFNTGNMVRVVVDTNYNFKYGNNIRDANNIYSRIEGYSNLKWFTDSTLLFAGLYMYSDWDPQHDDIGIAKTDTSFSNMMFERYGSIDTINYPAAVRIFDFKSTDSIYLCGTHNNIFGFYPHGISWISVRQLDEELQPRVEHFYGGDAFYYSYNLISTNDGGCLIAATRYDYQIQDEENDVYLLKLKREDLITSTDEVINSFSSDRSVVYPNPGSNRMIIETDDNAAEFCLYTSKGKLVFSGKIHANRTVVDCTKLPSGVYYYKLKNKDGTTESGKWIKY